MNEDQVRYVVDQRKNGVAEEALKDILRSHGYSEESIDLLLKEAQRWLADPQVIASTRGEAQTVTPTSHLALPSAWNLFSDACQFVFLQKKLCAQYVLIAWGAVATIALVAFLFTYTLNELNTWQFAPFVVATLVSLFFFVAVMTALVVYVTATLSYRVLGHTTATIWDSIQWTNRNFLSYAWLLVLINLVPLLGFTLFFIPGVIVALYVVVAIPVFFRENIRGVAALVRSTQLIQGYWWAVFTRLFIVIVIIMGVYLALYGASLFLMYISNPEIAAIAQILIFALHCVLQIICTIVFLQIAGRLHSELAQKKPNFEPNSLSFFRIWYKLSAFFAICVISVYVVFIAWLFSIASSAMYELSSFDFEDDDESSLWSEVTLPYTQKSLLLFADEYMSEHGDYTQLCDVLLAQETIDAFACVSSETAFVVSIYTPEGDYFCVDNTGFAGVIAGPARTQTQCLSDVQSAPPIPPPDLNIDQP